MPRPCSAFVLCPCGHCQKALHNGLKVPVIVKAYLLDHSPPEIPAVFRRQIKDERVQVFDSQEVTEGCIYLIMVWRFAEICIGHLTKDFLLWMMI